MWTWTFCLPISIYFSLCVHVCVWYPKPYWIVSLWVFMVLHVWVCHATARSSLEHLDGDWKDKPMDLYIRGKQKEWGGDRLSWLPGSSCLLITIWFYVDHLGKHKECGKSVCVCVCVCVSLFWNFLWVTRTGRKMWLEIWRTQPDLERKRNSPFSSWVPLRSWGLENGPERQTPRIQSPGHPWSVLVQGEYSHSPPKLTKSRARNWTSEQSSRQSLSQ